MLMTICTLAWKYGDWTVLLAAKRASTSSISFGTIIGCGAFFLAIGLAVVAYYAISQRKPTPESQARGLFRELCRAHHLTGSQTSLVWTLASMLKLPCPSVLFVDSSAWRIPDGNLDKKDWDKLQKIQKMLFQPPKVV